MDARKPPRVDLALFFVHFCVFCLGMLSWGLEAGLLGLRFGGPGLRFRKGPGGFDLVVWDLGFGVRMWGGPARLSLSKLQCLRECCSKTTRNLHVMLCLAKRTNASRCVQRLFQADRIPLVGLLLDGNSLHHISDRFSVQA